MKSVLRFVIVLCLLVQGLFSVFRTDSGQAFAQPIQRKPSFRRSAEDLPFYRLSRVIPATPVLNKVTGAVPFRYSKLRFAPVKILGRFVNAPGLSKKFPGLSRTFNQEKLLPIEQITRTQPGIVVELEPAYGIYNTFIGRLQHGTQFKGAHYYISGHWEKTDGERGDKREENIAAQAKVNVDLSKNVKISLDSAYFQSNVALPQLPDDKHHQKSAIQLIADLHINVEPDIDAALALSGEQARFSDQNAVTFELNSYGGQLTLKQLWSAKNTLSLHSSGYWDEYVREGKPLSNRYYGTSTLINSYALHDNFTVDAGVQFDYDHSEDSQFNASLIAPVVTTRWHIFRNTSVYATYHPRLKFPRFTDLYIRKLYTLVNPELHAEKEGQSVEAGMHQRFGDTVALNVGLFYHENEHVILQIDENNDHLLEYDQSESTDFIGVKANLQMNYRERFVQNITYTYTTHNIFAGRRLERLEADLQHAILPYQPNHQVQASIYWTTPFGLTIDFNGTYISEQFRNWYQGQNRIGRRFFLNVDLTQRITENFQVFLLGRNLTDTNTYDIIPILDTEEITSSRLFIAGVRLRF